MFLENLLGCFYKDAEGLSNPLFFSLRNRAGKADCERALDVGTGEVDFAFAVKRLV